MKPLLVLNDIHLGVQRMAGTTPASQQRLREDLHISFSTLINQHKDKDLCILGDLFDGFTVDIQDVLTCYTNLSHWISTDKNYNSNLYLVAGNHDIGKRNDRLSSFDVLATLLQGRYPNRVWVIKDCLFSRGNIYMIPHCMNQDLFNIELEQALTCEPGFLLLHANVDNGFTENSNHSLNVDGEWLTKLSKKHTIMFAHEHQGRKINYDNKPIYVLGNQWSASVSDCLAHGEAQKDGIKRAHVIHSDGTIEPIVTWKREGDFIQVDWTELSTPIVKARFIRVTGKASAAQASDVISAIAKFRQNSEALVITNGVQIDGVAGMSDLAEVTFKEVKSFDVLKALLEMLEPKEANVVRELLEVEG